MSVKSKYCLLCLIALGACSHSNVQEVQNTRPVKNELDGIWVGSFDIKGRGPFDFTAIHVGERSTAVSYKAKALCVGYVSQSEDQYLAQYNLYVLDGSPFDGARIAGRIKQGKIQSQFTTLNANDTGNMQLAYSQLYEQPSSLALLNGAWQSADKEGLVSDITIDNGIVSGVDSDGCEYDGVISMINPRYNAYDVSISISRCNLVNGDYKGLSYIDNQQDVYLRMDVASQDYGFHYDFKRQQHVQSVGIDGELMSQR